MTKIKESKKAPKKAQKERIEEEMTRAGKYYKIYLGDKLIEMLTEQEFAIRQKK